MIRAFSLAIAQLGDRAILAVLAKSIAITLLLFAGAGYGLFRLFLWLANRPTVTAWIGGTADTVGTLGGILATIALVYLVFPAVAMLVMGIFADEVVEAVERRHYPERAAKARTPGWGLSIRMALRSAGRVIGYNLLALPFYILLMVTGIGALLLFVLVNAIALGRDLGEMVAVRHMPRDRLPAWLAATRGSRAATGLAATALFMVPGLNLLAPILGAALATHRYRGI